MPKLYQRKDRYYVDYPFVFAGPNTGRLEFEDLGNNEGRSYLLCHGKKHSPKSY